MRECVVAANRIDPKQGRDLPQNHYDSSFITDAKGDKLQSADRHNQTLLISNFGLDALAQARQACRLFRNHR